MRVLWFCNSPGLGAHRLGVHEAVGAGWITALESALKEGSDVALGVSFPWDVPAVERIGEGVHAYLPFPRYPRGGKLRQALFQQSCRLEPESEVLHLERVIALAQPDLVHIWGTEQFSGLVADRLEIPVLVGIQGLRTQCSAVYCSGLSLGDLLRYGTAKHLLNGRSLLHEYFRYRRTAIREQRILRQARFVSGRTEWDRLACAALAPNSTYFHCDEVLRPEFHTQTMRHRKADEELRIISTVRGNAYKGVETVAECARLLRPLLGVPFKWTLVGIRQGEQIHRIVERKLGVSFKDLGIHLLGRKPAGEVAQELRASDVYVLSSRIENSPNGLCEAMMVGLPTVATNAGGTPSMLTHAKEGLLIPPGDPWTMAGAITRLASDSDLAAKLGSAARKRARQRHDPEAIVGTLLSIYREILAAGSR